MKAYHILGRDYKPYHGHEPDPWTLGEERTIDGDPSICRHGYHYCPTIWGALHHGGMANCVITEVDVDEPTSKWEAQYSRGRIVKGCSRRRRITAWCDVETTDKLMIQFTVDLLRWYVKYQSSKDSPYAKDMLYLAKCLESNTIPDDSCGLKDEPIRLMQQAVVGITKYNGLSERRDSYTYDSLVKIRRQLGYWRPDAVRDYTNRRLTILFDRMCTRASNS